eukprot:scaffold19059_cov39-Cyclotella_meneghiniana.AAC.2
MALISRHRHPSAGIQNGTTMTKNQQQQMQHSKRNTGSSFVFYLPIEIRPEAEIYGSYAAVKQQQSST